jgi:hypothetical protein
MEVMVPPGQDGVGTTHAGNRYDHFLISQDLESEEAIACEIKTFPGEDIAAEVVKFTQKAVSPGFSSLALAIERPPL